MERIVVVGSSGAGKTTVGAALAARLGLAHLELDAVHHLADWVPRSDARARALIEEFFEESARWVIDGNYDRYRDLVWVHADVYAALMSANEGGHCWHRLRSPSQVERFVAGAARGAGR